jgi:drug/metabolite transporter (DMT)-like permease
LSADLGLGLLVGLGAAICFGLSDVMATVVSRRVNALFAAAGMQATMLAGYLLLMAATGTGFPADPAIALQIVAFGCVSACGYLATYQAFRLGPITVTGPVVAAFGGGSVVLAVVVLGEALAPNQVAGVVGAVAGIVLLGLVFGTEGRGARLVGPGVPIAVLAMLLWASATVGLAGPSRAVGWLPTIALSRVASSTLLWSILAVVTVSAAVRRSHSTSRGTPVEDPVVVIETSSGQGLGDAVRAAVGGLDRRTALLLGAMGLFDCAGFGLLSYGLEHSAAWIVGITSSFGPSVTVLFGLSVLHERLRPSQWLGLGLVAGSVFLFAGR